MLCYDKAERSITCIYVPVYIGVNIFINKFSVFMNKPALRIHWLIHE